MHGQDKNKISDELMVRLLNGELNDQEADIILSGLRDEEKGRKVLEKKNVLDEVYLYDMASNIDSEKGLDRLMKEIDSSDTEDLISEKSKSISFPKQLLRVAAIIAILFSVGLIWYYTGTTNEVIVNADTEVKKDYALPDGSLVSLNEGASITYYEKLSNKQRMVTLTKGEVYFDVEHIDNTPFVINTSDLSITVLGTEFNVLLDAAGGKTEVMVNEGRVRLDFKSKGGKELPPVILGAGKNCIFKSSDYKVDTTSSLNKNSIIWKTGLFVFNETPLGEAFEIIGKEYDHKIIFDSPDIKNCVITGNINKGKLKTVLEVINLSINITSYIENNTIYIKGKGCSPS